MNSNNTDVVVFKIR